MWPFDRLKVGMKLTLLAGIPVAGALVLSALIAHDAQQRARTAAALGSIEDLAQLTARMTDVVGALQTERATIAFFSGLRQHGDAEVVSVERATDDAILALSGFLAHRDEKNLPPKLRADLQSARAELQRIHEVRTSLGSESFSIDETIAYGARVDDSLIGATAALAELADDGKLLKGISRLVSALQVSERVSREHALLSYVFGKTEFPPGTYRYFVTLGTEQKVYLEALRTTANPDEYERFERAARGPDSDKTSAMRKAAAETTDDALTASARDWFEAQQRTMAGLRQLELDMSQQVRRAAAAKVAETRQAVRLGIGLASSVVLVSLLIGIAIARSMLRSVRVLSNAAAAVDRDKDYSVRATKVSHDELGVLTDAFNSMLGGIQERDRELEAHRANLEALVEARTRQLSDRNRQMRVVLDNVKQGLVTIDTAGRFLPECSRAFRETFGEPSADRPFTELLSDDPIFKATLNMSYEQLMDDLLPVELSLDQMPRHLSHNGREYGMSFVLIENDAGIEGTLLVFSDITDELLARRAEEAQREQIRTFERVMRDRFGFTEFFTESRALIERIRDDRFSGSVERLRAVHTLKGNTAVFDVQSVSTAAHALESALIDDVPAPIESALATLLKAWDDFAARIVPILGTDLGDRVEVTRAELHEVLAIVRTHRDFTKVERALVRLEQEPAKLRFQRVAEQLTGLARRLGRPVPNVVLDAGDVRLPQARFQNFWSSFAHLLRNIVDHGLQVEEERIAAGKPPINTVHLRATSNDSSLVLDVADDGRGVNWNRIAEMAKERNLPFQTRAQLVEALMADGISTAKEITASSGRGVGMAAIRDACLGLCGSFTMSSEPNRGTSFRFVFPMTANEPTPDAARLSAAPLSVPPSQAHPAADRI